MTIEAIAARAGVVGKQTIYRWWPSKGAVVPDGLLAAANDDPDDLSLPDTGDIDADMRGVVHAVDPDLAGGMLDRLLGPHLAAIADRLRSARAAGQLRADLDMPVAVEMFVGPPCHRWPLRTGALTDTRTDTVTELALRALRT